MTDYNASGAPIQGSRGISKRIRDEFADIETAVNSKANIDSPAFTGIPVAPTAVSGTSTTQIATTAFVTATSFLPVLPGQAGNANKGIITDGSNASWSDRFALQDKANVYTEVQTMNEAFNTSRATVASHATNADIWGASGNEIDFTGTATITDFPNAPQAGVSRILHIASTPTFTHNANIFMPNDSNYIAEAGDIITVHAITTSTFRISISQKNQLIVRQRPIFSSETLDTTMVSSGENLSANAYSTGLPSGNINVVYGAGLFVAFTSVSSQYVATSPDGEVWTIRSMPSNNVWRVGVVGSNFMAVSSGTATATSSDGINWVAATALPGNSASNVNNSPVGIGGTWIVNAASATTLYRSTDNGATWTTQTLPATNSGGYFYAIGSVFLYYNSGAVNYTSSTGLTGSWSTSTNPDNSSNIWKNPDGSLGVGGEIVYRTIDGSSWSTLIQRDGVNVTNPHFYIDGVTGVWSTGSQESVTFHGFLRVIRSSTRNVTSNSKRSATDSSGTYILGSDSSYVIKVDDTLTGLFVL